MSSSLLHKESFMAPLNMQLMDLNHIKDVKKVRVCEGVRWCVRVCRGREVQCVCVRVCRGGRCRCVCECRGREVQCVVVSVQG